MEHKAEHKKAGKKHASAPAKHKKHAHKKGEHKSASAAK